MIPDYFKKYSNYYLSRYNVTKKKFENILKRKITKDFFEKKIDSNSRLLFLEEIPSVLNYYNKLGLFNEERLLEITLHNFEKKGYSKTKIKSKIMGLGFDSNLIKNNLNTYLSSKNLEEKLIKNFLNRTKIIDKQKKLNISDIQLFDRIMLKLSYHGFDLELSRSMLKKIIFNE